MKKPRRNKYEQIEDAFFDLEIDEQEGENILDSARGCVGC